MKYDDIINDYSKSLADIEELTEEIKLWICKIDEELPEELVEAVIDVTENYYSDDSDMHAQRLLKVKSLKMEILKSITTNEFIEKGLPIKKVSYFEDQLCIEYEDTLCDIFVQRYIGNHAELKKAEAKASMLREKLAVKYNQKQIF